MNNDIRVNSIGFLPARAKRASIINAGAATTWNLRAAVGGAIVASGALTGPVTDTDYGQPIWTADFTAYATPGTYYLEVPGVGQSVNFGIADNVYNNSLVLHMMGFYGWRCGTGVNLTHNAQLYSHGACHIDDGYLDYIGSPGAQKDSKRGWHDAGDYNKYIVNAGISVGCMLQAWEQFSGVLATIPLSHIPETGGGLPDYLAEIKWELDWVQTMQYSAADGRVGHKQSSLNFDAFEMPELDSATRYFVPYGTAATADFVAMLAKASRIYQAYDPVYAAKCLAAAQVSWNYLVANPADVQADQTGFGTGGYTTTDTDDRLWAAAEIWETTGNAATLTDLESRITAQGVKCDADWDWDNQKNLGIFVYALSARAGRNAALLTTVKNAIKAAADARVTGRNSSGYGRTLKNNFYWGSNGSVARSSLVLAVANILFPNTAYLDTASDQIGHLYGRNYYNRSQITGEGINPPLNPHHRPSGSDGIVNPWPGYLVGGGQSATGWSDTQASFQTNEVAINWSAALVYNLAMFAAAETPAAPTPVPTPPPCNGTTVIYRVNCGGGAYTPASGPVWAADQAWTPHGWGWLGGTAASTAAAIANTTEDPLYQSERYDRGQEYRFAVQPGDYQVTLRFAENSFSSAGARVFDVYINGTLAQGDIDIYSLAGGMNRAYDRTFSVTSTGGDIDIVGYASVDNAKFSAIEIAYVGAGCGTATSTPTATKSATPTPSPTATPTSSPTRTPTSSPSATPTATSSRTATKTASSTGTATATPSASLTATLTATVTMTGTPSPSVTSTPSVTLSNTPPPPGSSDTVSPTQSPSISPTLTVTPSSTATPTFTLSDTDTATTTATPSLSASETASPSLTFSVTSSDTPQFTPTVSPTVTLTLSSTPTVTPTRTGVVSEPVTPQAPPKIIESLPWPQPQPGPRIQLAFKLEGNADRIEIRVYSKAMVCVGIWRREGAFGPGWNQASFDSSLDANGLYYYHLHADGQAGSFDDRKTYKLFLLR